MEVDLYVQEVNCPLGHPMTLVRFFTDDMAAAVQQTIMVCPSSDSKICTLFIIFPYRDLLASQLLHQQPGKVLACCVSF